MRAIPQRSRADPVITDRSLITSGAIGRSTGGDLLRDADPCRRVRGHRAFGLAGQGRLYRHASAAPRCRAGGLWALPPLPRYDVPRCGRQGRGSQVSEGKIYDLAVIGSGTAAQVASFRVRAAGWSVALMDHLPFGGTCALRGCDPKKMLISGAEAIDMARRMGRRPAGRICTVARTGF